jgi:uncharacterized protein
LVMESMDLVRDNVIAMKKWAKHCASSTTNACIVLDRICLDTYLQANAMGTFNILNGEDRMVAVALILPESDNEEA